MMLYISKDCVPPANSHFSNNVSNIKHRNDMLRFSIQTGENLNFINVVSMPNYPIININLLFNFDLRKSHMKNGDS